MSCKHAFLAALLASALSPAAANAAVKITGISGNPGYETGTIHYTPGGIGGNAATKSLGVEIGRFQLNGIDLANGNAPVSYLTYCVDIMHYLGNGTFDVVPLSSATSLDLTKQSQLLTLLTNTANLITGANSAQMNKNISAGVQMAVWEIAFEQGDSGYNLYGANQGNFYVTNANSSAQALGQGYLNNLFGANAWKATPGYSLETLTAKGNQQQLFLVQSAVPEPAAWALMIAGFGMVGGVLRRQRKTTQLAFV